MPNKFEIALPEPYRDVARTSKGATAIEHAALNARAFESLLAIALQLATSGQRSIAIVTPELERVRFCLADWFARIGIRWKRIYSSGSAAAEQSFHSYRLGDSTVWLLAGTRLSFEDAPFSALEAVFIPRAHAITTDVPAALRFLVAPGARIVAAGEFADQDHWFYQWGRQDDVELVRLDADAVCDAFPDQRPHVYRESDPRYARRMALEDVLPRFEFEPFRVFSRKRLKVRTDKPAVFLNDVQIAEARARLGPDWESGKVGTPIVSLYPTEQQRLYLAVKRLAAAKGRKPWFLLLKARRDGYTTTEQAISYQMCVSRQRARVVSLAETEKKSLTIFRILKLFHDEDPQSPRLDRDAEGMMSFQDTRCSIEVGTAGGVAFARGDTVSRVHWSEVSKSCLGPKQVQKLDDLWAGLSGAVDNGEAVLETTANGREWFCQQYEDAKAGKNLFTPIFLPWFSNPANRLAEGKYDEEEIRDTLTDEERDLMVPRAVSLGGLITKTYELSIAQIAWRRAKQKQYGVTFPAECPEDDVSCFIASGHCWFNVGRVMDLLRTVPDTTPMRKDLPGGFEVRWKEPEEGRKYVIGVDCSEGIPGGDYGIVAVLDRETCEQVALVKGRFRPRELAGHVIRTALDYNRALTGVERQNHGHAVLEKIEDAKQERPHFRGGWLYWFNKPSDTWRSMDQRERRSRMGWSTDGTTRQIMLDDISEAVTIGTMKIRSRDFLQECTTFRKQSNGKYAADSAAHDDEVMAWAIAVQMRKEKRPEPRVGVIDVSL